MTTTELLDMLRRGEDSRHQFKRMIKHEMELAEDIVAFSNGDGGQIIVGVADDGTVTGLTPREVAELNKRISNAASQFVLPEPQILTENIELSNGLVVVITVPQGIAKPYQDKDGNFWVKKGADNRKAKAREELQRMFQSSGLIHADELPISNTSAADLDLIVFSDFYRTQYGESLDPSSVSLKQLLYNLNLSAQDGRLNIAGLLLFGNEPQNRLHAFIIKAASFPNLDGTGERYLDQAEFVGKISSQFRDAVAFLVNNTQRHQNNQSVNSLGEPEIPRIVWEELVANALIHRDYFVSATIRVFVFLDRMEIISPGHLPNNLTIDNIKAGNSNIRNPIIASFASKLLPYSGLGKGILRALKAYPNIDFVDDREGNQFKAIVKRPAQ
jgi:predicted HTH transcriptional regulator